jgi:hypothetical protein
MAGYNDLVSGIASPGRLDVLDDTVHIHTTGFLIAFVNLKPRVVRLAG